MGPGPEQTQVTTPPWQNTALAEGVQPEGHSSPVPPASPLLAPASFSAPPAEEAPPKWPVPSPPSDMWLPPAVSVPPDAELPAIAELPADAELPAIAELPAVAELPPAIAGPPLEPAFTAPPTPAPPAGSCSLERPAHAASSMTSASAPRNMLGMVPRADSEWHQFEIMYLSLDTRAPSSAGGRRPPT